MPFLALRAESYYSFSKPQLDDTVKYIRFFRGHLLAMQTQLLARTVPQFDVDIVRVLGRRGCAHTHTCDPKLVRLMPSSESVALCICPRIPDPPHYSSRTVAQSHARLRGRPILIFAAISSHLTPGW